MKFPRSMRSSGASLIVAVSLLLSSPVAAQRPAKQPAPTPNKPPVATAAAPAPKEQVPAATFETLLSADAYGLYAEMRMVGRHAASQEIAALIGPLMLGNGAQDELVSLYEFIKAHAEPLTSARLMVAAMPVRAELPEAMVAVEMPSVEAAQKFLPELNQFIAAKLAPHPHVPEATIVAVESTSPEESSNINNSRRRRRSRTRTTAENTRADAAKAPAVPPVQVKRSGTIIAVSNKAFTFKSLRGKDRALLFDEPGFQAARARFGADTLFIYLNTLRMTSSSKQQREALEKEYRRQEELARVEAAKQGVTANSNMSEATGQLYTSSDGSMNSNMNASVSVATSGNMNVSMNANVAMTPEGEILATLPPAPPEAEPSPKSEKELEEERQREESRQFTQTLASLVFGEGPATNNSGWPESIGIGVSLEADGIVARGLFVNLADDQPLRPIPFLPVVFSGPSIATEAPAVLPAETDIFVTASLDLTQMYDHLASMIKILDLAAASGEGKEGKGGLAGQLSSFEKTNNFRIKEDLLAALGNEIAIGMPAQFFGMRSARRENANEKARISGPITVVALNDKKALQELLPRVLAAIGFAGASEQSLIEKHGDVELLNFSNGTLAFIDRFLVSAPDPATMRRIADAYNNGETLANSERFRDSTSWQSKQAVGQVYVSNTMLKGMFEDVSRAANDIDDPAVRAYLLQLDPEPGAISHSATRESNGLMHEIHVPKNLLALIAASDLVNQKLSKLRGNESTAQWKLRMIHNAQNVYKQNAGRYATLEELKATDNFDERYGSLDMDDYELKFSVSGDKFEATATPKAYPKLGRRSFYIDSTGELRGGDTGGKPATASDPVIDN